MCKIVLFTRYTLEVSQSFSLSHFADFSFSSQDVKPHAQNILSQLFQILAKSANTPQKLAENDYLMKSKPSHLFFPESPCSFLIINFLNF